MTVFVKYKAYNQLRNIKEDKKMTFMAYIERQKSIIRSRHEGETYLLQNGEVIPLNQSEKILYELSSLKGLNTDERMSQTRGELHKVV